MFDFLEQTATYKKTSIQALMDSELLKNINPANQSDSPFEQLSERELQIAMMIVRGEKAPEIAEKLNISAKTINSYRYRIFEKFSITNDVELVHFAIKHKAFDIDTLE